MTKTIVYLASPYSNPSPSIQDHREQQITRIGALLTLKHKTPMFMPITQSAAMKRFVPQLGTTFEYWKGIDLPAIDGCAEVWVVKMPGWNESIGVMHEIRYAKENQIPVKYIDPKTLDFVSE
jgi:hypothetical protein